MTTTQINVSFIYIDKPIEILCTGKETINEIIKKFINKFNPDSKIHDYNFYYEGRIIEPKIMKDLLKIMNILVKKNLL